jgi:tRNA(adenine34) deaminase
MQLALAQARQARADGEVPVGAVVVQGERVLGLGRNQPIARHDPTAHAEVMALRAAAHTLGNYRLDGCELFVTLEPCAMCSGAVLHARLDRVVYGAADPKTGAAGSVIDLFKTRRLNHQTTIERGVLAEECGSLLADFFATRRALTRQEGTPLREDALRTPEARFQDLRGFPWEPRYLADLPSAQGLRLHYVDEGPRNAPIALLLHGMPTWSYLYRHMIPPLLAVGFRCIAPDHIGFGRSDKVTDPFWYDIKRHTDNLTQLITALDLRRITLFVQDWGGPTGLAQYAAMPERFERLVIMNTWLDHAGYEYSPGILQWIQQNQPGGEVPHRSQGGASRFQLLRGASRQPRRDDAWHLCQHPH